MKWPGLTPRPFLYKYNMRQQQQTLREAYTSLHATIKPNIALTIKPNNAGIRSSDQSILSFFKSINTGVCRSLIGTRFDKKQHLHPPALVVIEGAINNRHLHCSYKIRESDIQKFTDLFDKFCDKNLIAKHHYLFTSQVDPITSDGWLNYCTKFLRNYDDSDRIHFFGPVI